jgi:hypothetical protein
MELMRRIYAKDFQRFGYSLLLADATLPRNTGL